MFGNEKNEAFSFVKLFEKFIYFHKKTKLWKAQKKIKISSVISYACQNFNFLMHANKTN